ncbi:MAG: type II secretion system minor pseudopilin GspI [Aquisalimonadaceae bacterium]
MIKRRQSGFTLMEVLVAVAVLGIALAAIIKASSEMTANAVELRDRTLANWVAGNVLTELHITRAWEAETREGTAQMGDRDWAWEAEISTTANPALRRVDIRVFSEQPGDHPLTVLSGLLADPAQAAEPSPPPLQNGEEG